MDENAINEFLKKYAADEHTEQEHDLFVQWLNANPIDQTEIYLEKFGEFFKKMPNDQPLQHPALADKIDAILYSEDVKKDETGQTIQLWRTLKGIIAIAALLILITAISVYFIRIPGKQQLLKAEVAKNKVIPGSNNAVLTLSNGSKIILDQANNGVLATQGNIHVSKVNDGQLVYNGVEQDEGTGKQPVYNTLTTPRGGQYHVVLPDGSHVWLNSASSLKFPTVFTGADRQVELSGEGYFEVAKNKSKPFKVFVNNIQVEVFGTHFNIMAYPDEASVNTTLLEGSVKVVRGDQSSMLKPGQEAKVNDQIKIFNVNAAGAIEWKNGNFNFSHENIRTIMRKISRWYNVDVIYKGTITTEGFVGKIPRSENITEVLNMLELTHLVHFKIEERRIIVMP